MAKTEIHLNRIYNYCGECIRCLKLFTWPDYYASPDGAINATGVCKGCNE